VCELAAVRAVAPRRLVQQGPQASARITGRGRDARIEIEVEADRAALFRLESGKIAKFVPGDRSRQGSLESFPNDEQPTQSEQATDACRLLLVRNRKPEDCL
jgi:hypothetical protein